MKGKVALITGSTSGIGLGIARAFANAGFNLVIHGLESGGSKIAQTIAVEYNVETFYSSANLLNSSEIEGMVADAPTNPWAEEILMILPHLFCFIPCHTDLEVQKEAVKFMLIISFHLESGKFSMADTY